MRTILLLIILTLSVSEAQSITSTLIHAQFPELPPLEHKRGSFNDLITQALLAAGHGRFVDGTKLLQKARKVGVGARDRFLGDIVERHIASRRYSLIGGGSGNQEQLAWKQALANNAMPSSPSLPSSDANAALAFHRAQRECDEEVYTSISVLGPGGDRIKKLQSICESIRIPLDAGVLDPAVKKFADRLIIGAFALAVGAKETAERIFLKGKEEAKERGLLRAEAEFCLRLADLSFSPKGPWMSFGYALATEGVARTKLITGLTPNERGFIDDGDRLTAEKWLSDAAALGSRIKNRELDAAVAYRRGLISLSRLDYPTGIGHLRSAVVAANDSEWTRLAGMANGLVGIVTSNENVVRKGLSMMSEQGDEGGIGSLFELGLTISGNFRSGSDLRTSWQWIRILLRASAGRYGRAEQELLTAAAGLHQLWEDRDGTLYWLGEAAGNQRDFVASMHTMLPTDVDAPLRQKYQLGIRLRSFASELGVRSASEDSPHWSAQLAAVEAEVMSLFDEPRFEELRGEFIAIRNGAVRARKTRVNTSRLNSCADLLSASGSSDLGQDVSMLRVWCGDEKIKIALQQELTSVPARQLVAVMKANRSPQTTEQEVAFSNASTTLEQALYRAVQLGSRDLIQEWTQLIESEVGATFYSGSHGLALSLLNRDGKGAVQRALALRAHAEWVYAPARERLFILAGLVEGYASLGTARESLQALLGCWLELAGSLHELPRGPNAKGLLRRADGLRSPPPRNSKEAAILRSLALEDLRSPAEAYPPIDQILSQIPPATTVLVYSSGMFVPGEWSFRLWQLSTNSVKLVHLEPLKDFGVLLSRFRFALANGEQSASDSKDLYRHLIGNAVIPTGDTIAVAGGGFLSGIPLGSLQDGSGQFLGIRHPIVYLEDLTLRRTPLGAGKGVAVFGTSDALGQARAVAAITGARFNDENVSLPSLDRGRASAWTHFATHGRVDTENPFRSSLQLSRGERLFAWQLPRYVESHSMVVFGACDTNVSLPAFGEISRPGFARGMALLAHASGVPWVLSTLWKVDVRVTENIMANYYRELLRTGSPVQSMHQAVKVSTNKDPAVWAAFTLSVANLADLSYPIFREPAKSASP